MKTVLREQSVLAKLSRTELVPQAVRFEDHVAEKLKWLETNARILETLLDTWRATFDENSKRITVKTKSNGV